MADEIKNEGTDSQENTEQKNENSGQEPEKKYTEEEMNGISKKNSEKAVNKLLKELGITDKVKAKEILMQAAAKEAEGSEKDGTDEQTTQFQQALAKERERADNAILESLMYSANVDAKKIARAVKLIEREKCIDEDGNFDRDKAAEQIAELVKEWPELVKTAENSSAGFVIGGDGQEDEKKNSSTKKPVQHSWNKFNR